LGVGGMGFCQVKGDSCLVLRMTKRGEGIMRGVGMDGRL